MRVIKTIALLGLAVFAVGCSEESSEVKKRMDEIQSRAGGKIDPLPQVRPYELFSYEVTDERSPFLPGVVSQVPGTNSLRPDDDRPREMLEQFSLDTLRMVGVIESNGKTYGLIKSPGGLVSRVLVGQHLGQNDGKITEISKDEVKLIEIVSDGLGGFVEREAAIAISR
jgi:type IV pilus assembly protein PilP